MRKPRTLRLLIIAGLIVLPLIGQQRGARAPNQPQNQNRNQRGPLVGADPNNGRVVRVDTNQGISGALIKGGNEGQKQPTGYDKPCKPQTVFDTDVPKPTRISDAAGYFPLKSSAPGTQPVQVTEQQEAERLAQEQLRLRAVAEGRAPIENLQDSGRGPQTRRNVNPTALDAPIVFDDTVAFGEGGFIALHEGYEQVGIEPQAKILMAPAPTISGRVVDYAEHPVVAASVQAYAVHFTPLGKSLKWVKSTLTNDLGEYRLSWLPFGRYYIVAGNSDYVREPWLEGLKPTPNLPPSDTGMPLLFYPGVIAAPDAKFVTLLPVEAGIPHPVVNLALRERPRFSVRVRFLAEAVPSDANLVFLPYGGDLCAGMDYAIKPNHDGTFDVRDVPEGLYVAVAVRGKETISELMSVNVNKNIDDIKIPLVKSMTIRGTVYFTGYAAGLDLTPILQNMHVNMTRARSEISHVAAGLMDPVTGQFKIEGMGPGSYYPTVDVPRGSYVKDIRVMKLRPIPGVPDEQWPCDLPPSGAYRYLNANGHLQPLEVPQIVPGGLPSDPMCLNIEVSFAGRLIGRSLAHLCPIVPAPCPYPIGAVMVLMPASTWLKQNSSDVTPPDRILTTISGDGGPGRWEFRGLATDTDYRVFALNNLDPEMVYGPAFNDFLAGFAVSVTRNANACPEYRLRVPETDLAVPSRCEVFVPADEILKEAHIRVFQ
jgi:hypothetical protein